MSIVSTIAGAMSRTGKHTEADGAGTTAMATVAVTTQRRPLTGVERAAVLMLSLGEAHGANIWRLLDDDEIRALSLAMSTLGTIQAEEVEGLLVEFVSRLSATGALMGNFDTTERLLLQFLPPDRVDIIMEEIRGPAGRNMWEKLSNVQEDVLANYLKNEYPQTVAVVLSKIKSDHAARVLAVLPEDLALEVVKRMLRMEPVQKEILDKIEQTLRTEFMSNLAHDQAPRQPRADGRDLQHLRPPDRGALHHRARGEQPRERRAHQGADVHLRGPGRSSIRPASRR